jgi:hypothetical protein
MGISEMGSTVSRISWSLQWIKSVRNWRVRVVLDVGVGVRFRGVVVTSGFSSFVLASNQVLSQAILMSKQREREREVYGQSTSD